MLEIGGGLGVLSQRLADRAAHLHVVELDERLGEPLREALAPFDNVSLHFADALEIDLAALRPAPNKIVANLPYGIAATVILRTIDELDGVEQWVVMVQREVGERFAAAPGTPAYGVPSVLAQLACEVKVLRPIARTVFRPVPNVDSVLLGLRRVGPGADPAAERRSCTARSRTGARRWRARWRSPTGSGRGRARARPGGAGRAWPSRRRARRAPGARGVSRAGTPDRPMTVISAQAFAKVNLCLLVGGPRPDGRHELVTLFESVELVDELQIVAPSPSGGDEVVCAGVSGPNLVGEALARLRAAGWDAPPVRVEIEKRIPVAAGMGGGSADAAALLRCAPELGAGRRRGRRRDRRRRWVQTCPASFDPGLSWASAPAMSCSAMPELADACAAGRPTAVRALDRRRLPRGGPARLLGRSDAELARPAGRARVARSRWPSTTLPERLLSSTTCSPRRCRCARRSARRSTALREAGDR